MTTGRINQIAIPTDRISSEEPTGQPRPTDADPEPKLRTRTPVEALLINSRVCLRLLPRNETQKPSSDSGGRDSPDCSGERPHQRRSRVQGTTFAINYEARRTKRTKPDASASVSGNGSSTELHSFRARPITSSSPGAFRSPPSLHARPSGSSSTARKGGNNHRQSVACDLCIITGRPKSTTLRMAYQCK